MPIYTPIPHSPFTVPHLTPASPSPLPSAPSPLPSASTIAPHLLRYGASPSQYLLFTPSPRAPLVVLIHGGFWRARYGLLPPTAAFHSLAPSLHARGYAVAQIEYRRDGDRPWGYPHSNTDVLAAYRLATAQDIDLARVVVIGHSAGGTMALWLVAQCARGKAVRPVRTYALAPVADLVYAARLRLSDGGEAVQRYVGGEPHEVPRRYEGACPMFWAAELVEGVTLAVGRTDTDVPVEVVERLAEEIGKVDGQRGLEYWVLEETNHYQIVDAETPAWRTIADDIDRRLQ